MPTQAQIEETVEALYVDGAKFHDIIHGDAATEIETEAGPVKTIAGLQEQFAVDAADLLGEVRPRFGEGQPAADLGGLGAVYYDQADPDNPVFYGPKTADGWPVGVPLIGPPGEGGAPRDEGVWAP